MISLRILRIAWTSRHNRQGRAVGGGWSELVARQQRNVRVLINKFGSIVDFVMYNKM